MEDRELLIEDNESCFELRLEDLNVDNDEEEACDEDLVGSGTLEMEYSSGIDRKFVSFSHLDISSSPFSFSCNGQEFNELRLVRDELIAAKEKIAEEKNKVQAKIDGNYI